MRMQIVARQEEDGGKWTASINSLVLEADSLDGLVRQCREALRAGAPMAVEGVDYEIVAVLQVEGDMTAMLPATPSLSSSR